ncbi:non-ribosomal peptide synthetase [Herbaspirillum sp. meg3]|uniref:non-ribosomal peptide synthetase n=1 Tax=Herbaspirillum sp. meg3 TaxID=2025949 RepID=UPI000B98D584|nr:non-ribosomal peptide synthetase [Herbaspirillum sp. meg3]ASU38879.1 non-ribosomal peptide synthetase [Herbaspirillum sp. meg3]
MNEKNNQLLALLQSDAQEQALRYQSLSEHSDRLDRDAGAASSSPLSFSQQQLWYLQQMEPQQTAYNLTRAFRLHGTLDHAALEAAFAALIARHASLRTCFVEQDGIASQQVTATVPFAMQVIDCSEETPAEQEHIVAAQIDAAMAHVFDLREAPLLFVRLLKLGQQEGQEGQDSGQQQHVLLIGMHHIISDAWSNPIVANDLQQAYRLALAEPGCLPVLPALPLQYADYARWQREHLQGDWLRQELDHWQTVLGDDVPPLNLPLDRPRSGQSDGAGAALNFSLDTGLAAGLRQFCRDQHCTPFVVLLAAWQVLLRRYSGQDNFAVGVPQAGRNRPELQDMVGFFVTTQVMRARLGSRLSLRDACRQVRSAALTALEHAELPFELLLERYPAERGLGRHPLFQTMFGLQIIEGAATLELDGVTATTLDIGVRSAKFDLALDIKIINGKVNARLEYSSEVFSAATMQRIARHYQAVLAQMTSDPDCTIGDLVLSDEEEQQTLLQWSRNTAHANSVPSILSLIEQQVMLHARSSAVRVVQSAQTLTYEQLNRHSNQLAHWLIGQGVGPDSRVGVAMERSQEMVVALLAIMKAGGAYVPMDPDHPPQRLSYFIEDSRIGLLLTQAAILPLLPLLPLLPAASDGSTVRVIDVATLAPALSQQPAHNPALRLHPEHLAYVIYTSGSTGQPKGAANRHSSLVNRLMWMQQAYGLGPGDKVLQKTPFGFDVSVWEFFWPLMTGAELVMAPPGAHRDPAQLGQLIREYGITTLHFVPSMLQAFVSDIAAAHCPKLQRVICSGEALPMELQQQTQRQLPQAQLINLYGPTEAAIDVTHWTCRVDDRSASVPIGRPISATQTYILDDALQLVPQGVAGELYLGGVNLARGYLGKPGLTAERFVASPFSANGERLYRTGDLVRWREDGQIMYLGRLDHQVKIRGLRIELGEIEAALLAQAVIREVVVVAVEVAGSKQLVAYVSARAGAQIDAEALRMVLGRQLPDYMVPTVIMELATLPLSTNGKIDRKALPAVQTQSEEAYAAPQGDTEQQLAQIWQTVLGLPQVGRHDNFFALGGDSILSLQIIARMRQAGWKITPKQVFERQSVALLAAVAVALAPVVSDAAHGIGLQKHPADTLDMSLLSSPLTSPQLAQLPVPQERMAALYPLSPMQTGMLFHSVYESGSAAYINQLRIDIDGALDSDRFRAAWQAVQQEHDVLRTGFLADCTPPLQWVARTAPLPLEDYDVRAMADPGTALDSIAAEQLARGFDLNQPPLQRLALVRTGEVGYHFIWTVHHLLLDGWSTSQLLGEVVRRYHGAGTSTVQTGAYRDYIRWLQQQDGEEPQQYWQALLTPLTAPTYLHQTLSVPTPTPTAVSASVPDAESFGEHRIVLSVAQTEALASFARTQRVTLNTLVQAAWGLLLQRYTGQPAVCFGATVAGRPDDLAGAEHLLGLFINTLPVMVPAQHGQSISQWLQDLQAQNLASRTLQHTPLYDIQRWHAHLGQSLFDSILVFENYPIDAALRDGAAADGSLRFKRTHSREQTNYPMTVGVSLGDGLNIGWRYDRSHFSDSAVLSIARQLQHCLQELIAAHDQPTGALSILDADEQRALLKQGQGQAETYAAQPVHVLFQQIAQRTPLALAVRMGEDSLSYSELDARANRLAHLLMAQAAAVDAGAHSGGELRIGVALPRSPQMIVALLAVLKAGAAYVPLDPETPAERLTYMLDDAGVSLLLTQRDLLPPLPPLPPSSLSGLVVLELDALDLTHGASHAPAVEVSPAQMAYVIYTSGSTGKAKGVAVTHGPLSMHIQATATLYEMGPQSRELHFLSFSFDGAHERWMTVLSAGGTLVLRDPDLWTAEQTVAALHRHGITHAGFPPVYLKQLADWVARTGNPPPVFLYSFGGEAMPQDTFEQVRQVLRPQRLINGYGPTETVVTPLVWKVDAQQACDAPYAPIGSPVGARTAMILDDRLQLLPRGVAGELYIGGSGLARGYLDRPGLTAASFLPDPFGEPGARMYRTGDLVRWREDGQIAYLGRIDHQVKIKGFRIELGEVEAALLAQPGIRQAVAVVRRVAEVDRLWAYVSAHADAAPDLAAVQRALAATLPGYMVPGKILLLDALPLNPNGKIDRKALPQDAGQDKERAAGAPADLPDGELETRIAACWEAVLGVTAIGRHDNFFELGGDSILSLQIIARLRQDGWKVTPKQIFEQQTVAALALVAEAAGSVSAGSLHRTADSASDGEVPLLPIQAQFFASPIPSRHHWNQAVMLRSPRAIDAAALQGALLSIVNQHDALRMRFEQMDDGAWRQTYSPPLTEQDAAAVALLWQKQVDASALDEVCAQAQRSLDLTHGPLLRAVCMALEDGSWRLLVVVHHLVVDGVSWRVLLEDLQTAYAQRLSGQDIVLPAKTDSYRDWGRVLQDFAPTSADELAYWQALSTTPAGLPCDMPQAPLLASDQARAACRLDVATTQALLKQAPAAYRTQINDLLLAALGQALGQWSGLQQVLITLEGHGREQLDDDIDVSRTVGWFTSVMPVALPTSGTLPALITAVKETLRAIPRKGIGFGLLRQWGTAQQRAALETVPTAALAFNYLGQFDGNFRAGDDWQPAAESPGASRDAAAPMAQDLSINGQIVGGELRLEATYSKARYHAATIDGLMQLLERALHDVVTHCCSGSSGITPSDFPLARLTQPQLDSVLVEMDCRPAQIEDIYPTTPLQRGMLLHLLRAPYSTANVVQLDAHSKTIDVARFRQAWTTVLQRHPVLRTAFVWSPLEVPQQVVLRQATLPMTLLDWRGRSSQNAEQEWLALCRYEHQRGFDARRPPLMRFVIAQLDDGVRLLWTWHHILLDGWSMSQLLGEVFSLAEDKPVAQQALPFSSYMAWLAQQSAASADSDEAYWRAQFARCAPSRPAGLLGATPAATALLPAIEATCNSGAPSAYATVYLSIDQERSRRLQSFAGASQVTLNTLVQAAWSLLLHEYTGAVDVVFGVTVSGRSVDFPGIERVMGMCINTLPLIQRLDAQHSVVQWLAQLQAHNLNLRQREHVALGDVLAWSGQATHALFDTLMIFENFPVDESLKKGVGRSLAFDTIRSRGASDFALTLVVLPGTALRFQFEYDAARLAPALVEQVAQRLAVLLDKLSDSRHGRLADFLLAAPVTPAVPMSSAIQTDMVVASIGATTSAVEAHLISIWQAVLHQPLVKQVTPDDDFFALGGNSLQAMQVLTRWNAVARDHGLAAMQPADVFSLPVLRELASMLALRNGAAATLMHHQASRSPDQTQAAVLVCFPARMSNADEYRALAETLGQHHSVLQLLCPPEERWRWSSMDVVALATQYAGVIKRDLQGKRCCFLGWSVGGLLALETARQLRQSGADIPVDWIGLADSSDFSVLRGQLAQMSMPPQAVLAPQEARLAQWLQRSAMAERWHALLAQMTSPQRAYFLLEVVARAGDGLPLDGSGQEGAEAALWERIRCLRLGLETELPPAPSVPLHVWQAGRREAAQVATDWRAYAAQGQGQAEVSVVDADHLSLLTSPAWHVQVAALM